MLPSSAQVDALDAAGQSWPSNGTMMYLREDVETVCRSTFGMERLRQKRESWKLKQQKQRERLAKADHNGKRRSGCVVIGLGTDKAAKRSKGFTDKNAAVAKRMRIDSSWFGKAGCDAGDPVVLGVPGCRAVAPTIRANILEEARKHVQSIMASATRAPRIEHGPIARKFSNGPALRKLPGALHLHHLPVPLKSVHMDPEREPQEAELRLFEKFAHQLQRASNAVRALCEGATHCSIYS